MDKKTVITGMSGGVDSSAVAYILKEQGYNVIGVTMQTWQDDCAPGEACGGSSAIEDARRVAGQLGIPYYVIDFQQEFRQKVINYFIDE